MFNVENAITEVPIPKHKRNRFIGEVVYTQEKYKLLYEDVYYNIKRLHRYVGETLYSTHRNDKHPIGTSRVVNDILDPDNLKIINNYWYRIYDGMKVEFTIVDKQTVNIEGEDYAIKRIAN